MEYYILSLKWSKSKEKYVWWGPDNSGYTEDLNVAGIYTEEQLSERPLYYKNDNTYPVPVDFVNSMFIQRIVPTRSENWNLMNIDLSSLKHY